MMRVRISFDALRLCLLVAAGVTSGYLWRAAFESSAPEDVRVAAKPRIIEPAPPSPVVRIPPGHLVQPTRSAGAHPVAGRSVGRSARSAPAGLISASAESTPTQTPQPPAPTPAPGPTQTPKPPSTPPTQPPSSQPPSTPPPTQTTTTTPAAASPPTQTAAAPTPAAPTPAAPPPTTSTTSEDDTRPGWGKGDKNHDHSGPGNKNP